MLGYHPSAPPFSPCLKLQCGQKQPYKFTSLKHCVLLVKIRSTSQLWKTKGERKRSVLTKSLLWELSRSWWSPACFKWQKLGVLSARNTLLALPARFKPLPPSSSQSLCPLARSLPTGNIQLSNKAAPLSMTAMIISYSCLWCCIL